MPCPPASTGCAPVTIPAIPTLLPRERRAVQHLIARARAADAPPLLYAFLFGSKARGDFDELSDVDLLLVCDIPEFRLDDAARWFHNRAMAIGAACRVALEPWVVHAGNLRQGARTPMLVDAIHDGIPLWPPGLPLLHLPFTPADARFCASRLLEWVDAGGPLVHDALRHGERRRAAGRARDDITRLATAALLLTGDTRHRKAGSLDRFHRRFVATGIIPPTVLPALAWARRAYPPDGGRGTEEAPVTDRAAATAELGARLAAVMEEATLPWILDRIRRLGRRGAGRMARGPAAVRPRALVPA